MPRVHRIRTPAVPAQPISQVVPEQTLGRTAGSRPRPTGAGTPHGTRVDQGETIRRQVAVGRVHRTAPERVRPSRHVDRRPTRRAPFPKA